MSFILPSLQSFPICAVNILFKKQATKGLLKVIVKQIFFISFSKAVFCCIFGVHIFFNKVQVTLPCLAENQYYLFVKQCSGSTA